MAHCIEVEPVAVTNPKLISEIFQLRLERFGVDGVRVDEGDTEDDHTAAVVSFEEIDSFAHFATRDTQKDGTTAGITRLRGRERERVIDVIERGEEEDDERERDERDVCSKQLCSQ